MEGEMETRRKQLFGWAITVGPAECCPVVVGCLSSGSRLCVQ